MPNVLCDDFIVLLGDVPQAAMPGAAGGRFATLGVLNAKGTLQLIYRPEVANGTKDVYSTGVPSDVTAADVDKATIRFALPAPYSQNVDVVFERSPGVSDFVHRVDMSNNPALYGQFVVHFWDGSGHRRAKMWRYANG